MKEKIERLVIAACVGATAGCIMAWVIFFPVRPVEAISVPETHPFGCPTNPAPHGAHE